MPRSRATGSRTRTKAAAVARQRFALRYRGDGPIPEADAARVRALADVVVVDESPRMLLVEVGSRSKPLEDLVAALPDWVLGRDLHYEVPDTRRTDVRPPD